jgi:hypothetical protein
MLRFAFALPGVVLAAAIFWAIGKADFWASGAALVANPWGLVTLVDLYAGLIVTGLLVSGLERWKAWTFALMLVSFLLGNVVYAAWGAWRGAHLLAQWART